jgi:hypothetical protein
MKTRTLVASRLPAGRTALIEGEKPANLPVQAPTKYVLTIKCARQSWCDPAGESPAQVKE